MILILIILIVIIAIGITIVMLTTGKTDITTITLTDIKKGLSSGISSVISGEGLCQDGKIMFNNNCYSKKKNSDCDKFEIPDPATNFTSCKKLDDNDKKQKCIDEGKILYNNKCLVKINQEYCLNKGSFLKPEPETNETSCTEMSNEKFILYHIIIV